MLGTLFYLGIDSDMEGGERVEQPGEGGGAEEEPLDKLLELLSTALKKRIIKSAMIILV